MRPKRGRSLDIGVIAPSLGSKGQIKLSYRHPRVAWLAEAPRPYINGLVHIQPGSICCGEYKGLCSSFFHIG